MSEQPKGFIDLRPLAWLAVAGLVAVPVALVLGGVLVFEHHDGIHWPSVGVGMGFFLAGWGVSKVLR